MPKTNQSTIQMILSIFNECYPGKVKVTERTEGLWLRMLEDLDSDALLAAAHHLCSTRPDWPPDIATMRGTVVDFTHGYLEPPSSHEAWEHVLVKMTENELPELATGEHVTKIELTGLEKAAVKQVGSIYDLKRSTNGPSDRSQFIKAFDKIVTKKRLELTTLPEVKRLVEARAGLKLSPAPNNKSLDKTSDKGPVCKPEEVKEMLADSPNPAELKAMFQGAGLLDD